MTGRTPPRACAVVPVRGGVLPSGAIEAVADAGGRVVIVGEAAVDAAGALGSVGSDVRVWETPGFAPGRWAATLAPVVADADLLLLPGSPDGRDLAPRLAAALRRPLLTGAVDVRPGRITTSRAGGSVMVDHDPTGPVVVTVQPGLRPVEAHEHGTGPTPEVLDLEPVAGRDAEVVDVLGPDVATMDLVEAPRIVGGGAGLDSADRFDMLGDVAVAIGAAMGATRVVTDRGWLTHERQIGTTGVVVQPSLYLAFGISGAVQHTAGLGDPDHIISVNTEPHCPMMSMADLAIVADANATVDALHRRLTPAETPPGASSGASSGAST